MMNVDFVIPSVFICDLTDEKYLSHLKQCSITKQQLQKHFPVITKKQFGNKNKQMLNNIGYILYLLYCIYITVNKSTYIIITL